MREQILAYAIRYRGDWSRIARAIQKQEEWQRVPCAFDYITIVDPDYPSLLRGLRFPPWVLFWQGDLRLLNRPAASVVGARQCSEEGKRSCQSVVGILKKRYVIVSGLAWGIDRFAHQSALDTGTIGVIGCGLDVVYPKGNAALYAAMRQRHLLLSEYPPGASPLAHHFPWRNRIIAALGVFLIVIEAKPRSGTMHTVNEALELSRPIYCVSRSYLEDTYTGTALLIAQGAGVLLNEEDVKEL